MIGKILNNFDKKYAFGLTTGLLFGLLGVYTDFFRSTNPQIQFDILSNATVVDLKENIGKIDILYDSISILSKKQTLSLITVKITNNGNSDVLKNFYDLHFPLGFNVDKGIILEKPTLIQSSSEYIGKSIGLTSKNQNEINFTDFIFEKDEFFVLKILVLHTTDKKPEIIPHGKIAGVKKINITKSYLSKEAKTFWEKVFDGSVLIHVTRFFTYLFSLIVFILAILLPITFVSGVVGKRKRKKKLNKFKTQINRELTEPESCITKFFVENGIDALKRFTRISAQFHKYKRINQIINSDFELHMLRPHEKIPYEMITMELIKELKEKQFVTVQEGKIIFKDNLEEFINQLIGFIETNG